MIAALHDTVTSNRRRRRAAVASASVAGGTVTMTVTGRPAAPRPGTPLLSTGTGRRAAGPGQAGTFNT